MDPARVLDVLIRAKNPGFFYGFQTSAIKVQILNSNFLSNSKK